jgi:hypothetical protein
MHPDDPPPSALPLFRARLELAGDPLMVHTLNRLELQLAPLRPLIAAGDFETIRSSAPIRRDLITTRDWLGEKLIRRLRTGELVAWGRARAAGWRWCLIPIGLWGRVAVLDWELGEVGHERPDGEVVDGLFDVVVAVAEGAEGPRSEAAAPTADETTPPPAPTADETTPPPHVSTPGAERRCFDWLVGLMAGGSRQEGPRVVYYTLARERFGPGLGVRGFGRAWGSARAQCGNINWGRGGRPRKPKH